MKYPKMRVLAEQRQMIDVFGGYNNNLRINENEFAQMENMTSDFYPVLSPRKGRGVYLERAGITGLIEKDALCYTRGKYFGMNEYEVDMGLNDEPKQLVSMGAYVIILPDKKYINTADISDYGDIEVENTAGSITAKMVKEDGTDHGTIVTSPTEPEGAINGDLWIDTSSTPHVLKQYSSTSSLMWVPVATTYVKISGAGIGNGINAYDGVTISGMIDERLNGSFVVQSAGADYVTVIGLIDTSIAQAAEVTVSRYMPDMDFVTECGNRLWGCRYGFSADGRIVNEIYASKLGDFRNWECYMGISTDSWRASVGTDGKFTGATTHMGYPVFFKENCLHKVYISSTGAHQVQDTACRGVQDGCGGSLAIVNETLYYKARSGIMAYDGSLPVSASYALGDVRYKDAVAAAHGNKYYVSMLDYSNNPHLFVYDTSKGMWHREDNARFVAMCSCRGELYAVPADRAKIVAMTADEDTVEWSVQTGEIGLNSPDMKFISRLTLRMFLPIGSSIKIYAQYGFDDAWHELFSTTSTRLRSFSVPIRPKRCDFMRLKIEGVGDAKIYSMTKTMRNGSELS